MITAAGSMSKPFKVSLLTAVDNHKGKYLRTLNDDEHVTQY